MCIHNDWVLFDYNFKHYRIKLAEFNVANLNSIAASILSNNTFPDKEGDHQMWESINGEWIYMDKEMGADEYARQNSSLVYSDDAQCCVRAHGDRLTTGRLVVGVAGGMIVAKAVSRIGVWLLWVAIFAIIVMIMS